MSTSMKTRKSPHHLSGATDSNGISGISRLFHKFFYRYGLMCASHPLEAISICLLIITFSAFPFVRSNISEPVNGAVPERKFSLFVPSNDQDHLTEESVHRFDSGVYRRNDGTFHPSDEDFTGETLGLKRVILSTSEEALYGPGILTKDIMSNLFSIHEGT